MSDIVIQALRDKINELEESIYIDALRLNKEWPPVIVPEIIELETAIKIIEENSGRFTKCCEKLCDGCSCMEFINRTEILKKK